MYFMRQFAKLRERERERETETERDRQTDRQTDRDRLPARQPDCMVTVSFPVWRLVSGGERETQR